MVWRYRCSPGDSLEATQEVPLGVAGESRGEVALVAIEHEAPVPFGGSAFRWPAVLRRPDTRRHWRPIQPLPLPSVVLSSADPEWPACIARCQNEM